ncbi:DNA (cytosine-5-)-methyltransferase [Nonomuraea sp. NPDC049152]|uniref:DNA cytosine methyltransferase n=1 Tax=Nonomuraea sp. NPDC049152 TaxID=3154350 RepID=UPI0033E98655
MCTGYGGLDLAVMGVYGARLAWCADNDPHVAEILDARFPTVPNLGDLTTVDWSAIPRVDIVTAGFPCTDISYAGRGAGLTKETRSGLWFTIADALRVLRPGLVILENVAALRRRGLDRVLGDLAALGYDTAWTCLRASDVGAPHRRERLFILAVAAADPRSVQPERRRAPGVLAGPAHPAEARPGHAPGDRDQAPPVHPESLGREQGLRQAYRLQGLLDAAWHRHQDWGPYEPAIRRWEAILGRPAPNPTELGTRGQPRLAATFVEWLLGLAEGHVTAVPGLPRTAKLKALGNGVVPQQAAFALRVLTDRLGGES